MRYNIYAGLRDSFGGSKYLFTEDFDTAEEAVNTAYQEAFNEYLCNEGTHGILSWEDVKNNYCKETSISESDLSDYDYKEIDRLYNIEIDHWICYDVTIVEEES